MIIKSNLSFFNTERVMRWSLILEEFGPELKYLKGEKNVEADALSILVISGNQEILNISEIYGCDETDMPDSAYPICYHDIAKAQKTDAKIKQELISHKYYTLNNFCGGDQNHRLIFRNSKMCFPAALQNKNIDWYHKTLCHPGDTSTEHTLHQHFDLKGLHTTVHNVCKNCPTCRRAKTTNQIYVKLPSKQDKTKP